MSTENIAKFTAALAADPTLAEKVRVFQQEPSTSAAEKIAALAAELGFPITPDEVLSSLAAESELSDESLDQVSGGYRIGLGFTSVTDPGSCVEKV